jgi:hypothetical protein
MDELLTIALVGTAKKRPSAAQPKSAAGELVSQLSDLSPERQLLLEAGASAALEFAGAPAKSIERHISPAPAESLQIVSPRAASMLGDLLQRSSEKELLLEACQLLRDHKQVLAPQLLPDALAAKDNALQAALLPVFGERGRWLSQFDKAWHWATAPAAAGAELTEAELEAVWNEGLPAARQAALEQLRRTNPERARQWLAEAWPREKAEVRLQLLETVSQHMGEGDISFLEGVATDRSAPVRSLASELLSKLEGSSQSGRVREWSDPYITAAPKKSLTAKLRKLACGDGGIALTISPPEEFDPAWRELGIAEKPPAHVGKRAYWLVELLRRVNPIHWQKKFDASPSELIAAAERDEFGHDVIQAWSDAAILFRAQDWAAVLWEYWLTIDPARKKDDKRQLRIEMLPRLLASVSTEDAEQLVADCLARPHVNQLPIRALVEALGKPWSAQFSTALLRRICASLVNANERENRIAWAETLDVASTALPANCFSEALADWTLPEDEDYYTRHFSNQLAKFLDTVQTRARLRELITGK